MLQNPNMHYFLPLADSFQSHRLLFLNHLASSKGHEDESQSDVNEAHTLFVSHCETGWRHFWA